MKKGLNYNFPIPVANSTTFNRQVVMRRRTSIIRFEKHIHCGKFIFGLYKFLCFLKKCTIGCK